MNEYPQSSYFRIVTFVFCFFLLISAAHAQFREGFIVSLEGDTTAGWVKYLDWEISPDYILFKDSQDGSEREIGAEQIQMFHIKSSNERFVSKRVGIVRVYEKDILSYKPSIIPNEFKYLFLQTILQGPEASLYKYVNEYSENHFFIETPIGFQELINYSFRQTIDDKTYEVTIKDYEKQLASICSNAPAFKAEIPYYSEKYLKIYLEKYNSCFSGETIVYRSENPRITFDVLFGSGFERLLNPSNNIRSNEFMFGGGVRVNFPKAHYNRFLRLNMDFITNYKMDKTHTLRFITLGLGRYYGVGKLQPYLFFSGRVLINNIDMDKFFMISANVGLSYRKKVELEIGNWNNLMAIFFKDKFFVAPGITLHYYPIFRNKKL